MEAALTRTIEELADRWLDQPAEALGAAERAVLRQAIDRRPVSTDTNAAIEKKETLGDRLADAIARFGGSWGFILGFVALLAIWTFANGVLLTRDAFDPYPFIFLNLVLSMLAALQAPVIMMSQNRQAARDRLAAAHDYRVNLKAEIEIMALHEKLDEMRQKEIRHMLDHITLLAERIARMEARTDLPGSPPQIPS
jgi:uncharacterized membrane protein